MELLGTARNCVVCLVLPSYLVDKECHRNAYKCCRCSCICLSCRFPNFLQVQQGQRSWTSKWCFGPWGFLFAPTNSWMLRIQSSSWLWTTLDFRMYFEFFSRFVDPSTKARQAFLLNPIASFELSEAGNLDTEETEQTEQTWHVTWNSHWAPHGHPMGTEQSLCDFCPRSAANRWTWRSGRFRTGNSLSPGKAKQSNYMIIWLIIIDYMQFYAIIPDDSRWFFTTQEFETCNPETNRECPGPPKHSLPSCLVRALTGSVRYLLVQSTSKFRVGHGRL